MRANEREVLRALAIAYPGALATRDLMPRLATISAAADCSRALYNLRKLCCVETVERLAVPGSHVKVNTYRITDLGLELAKQPDDAPTDAVEMSQPADHRGLWMDPTAALPSALDDLPDEDRVAAAAAWSGGPDWIRPPDPDGPAADYAGRPADDLMEAFHEPDKGYSARAQSAASLIMEALREPDEDDPVLAELRDLVIIDRDAPLQRIPEPGMHARRLRSLADVLTLPPISVDSIAATRTWLRDLAELIDPDDLDVAAGGGTP